MAGPRRGHRGSYEREADTTRINHRIKASEVRVVDDEGNQLGVMTLKEALQIAYEKGLDLVEVASQAKPPVCRVIDYGKYKYEVKQRLKAAKKKSAKSMMKELKFRPKIGKHDIDVRVKHARKFLLKGYKVRLIVRFRGREHSHPEIAKDLLEGVFKELKDICDIETHPKKEGAIMIMNVAPNPAKIAIYKKAIEKGERLALEEEEEAELEFEIEEIDESEIDDDELDYDDEEDED